MLALVDDRVPREYRAFSDVAARSRPGEHLHFESHGHGAVQSVGAGRIEVVGNIPGHFLTRKIGLVMRPVAHEPGDEIRFVAPVSVRVDPGRAILHRPLVEVRGEPLLHVVRQGGIFRGGQVGETEHAGSRVTGIRGTPVRTNGSRLQTVIIGRSPHMHTAVTHSAHEQPFLVDEVLPRPERPFESRPVRRRIVPHAPVVRPPQNDVIPAEFHVVVIRSGRLFPDIPALLSVDRATQQQARDNDDQQSHTTSIV